MLNLNNIRLTLFHLTLLIAVSASAARAQERIVKVGIPAVNMSVISFSTSQRSSRSLHGYQQDR